MSLVVSVDEILPGAGAFYVMDRGYVDFERRYVFTLTAAFFVTRTKTNVRKRPGLDASLYQIPQILNLTLFAKMPFYRCFMKASPGKPRPITLTN